MKKVVIVFSSILILLFVGIGSMVRFDIPVEKIVKKYSTEHTKSVVVDGLRVYYNDEGQGIPLSLNF